MKILVLAPQPFFQNRGTPIAVRGLLETLSAAGHRVDLLAYHEGESIPLPAGELHRIPALPGIRGIRPGFSVKKLVCDAAMFLKALALVRRGRYDLVHAVEESSFMALVLRRIFGVPYVFDMDSSLAQQMVEKYPWLRSTSWLLERAEGGAVRSSLGVLAVCRSLELTALRYAPGHRTVRLEDVSLLDGAPAGDPGRTALGVAAPRVLYVGNLERYQGIDLLVESFQVLEREKVPGNLVIIGGTAADIEAYTRKAADLGLGSRIHFLGPKPLADLGAYLTQADILVSPRIRGLNTPMKVYSYLDSGRPLIATKLPTHTQVLDDSIALLVDPDPEAMGAGIVRLLRDSDLAASLARRAKERAAREFTAEAYRRKLLGFYGEIERTMRDGGTAS